MNKLGSKFGADWLEARVCFLLMNLLQAGSSQHGVNKYGFQWHKDYLKYLGVSTDIWKD